MGWGARARRGLGVALAALSFTAVALAGKAGKLDKSFSGDGKATVDFGSTDQSGDAALDVMGLGGDILAVGRTGTGSASDFALLRLKADGSPSAAFGGGDGKATTDLPGSNEDAITDATSAGGGGVLVAGQTRNADTDMVVARYDAATGELDPSFNQVGSFPGTIEVDFGDSSDDGAAALVKSQGKLVVAGSTTPPSSASDLALVRLNEDGTLDDSDDFGSGGKVVEDIAGEGLNDFVADIEPGPNGKLLVAGTLFSSPSTGNMFVARFLGDGTLDEAFGDGGVAVAVLPSEWSATAGDLQVLRSGKIVVTGGATRQLDGGGFDADMALAGFKPTGKPDKSFGKKGVVRTSFKGSPALANDLAIDSKGRLVAFGLRFDITNYAFALARYKPDGRLDRSFSGDGRVITDVTDGTDGALAGMIGKKDRPVAIGTAASDFAVVRYLAK